MKMEVRNIKRSAIILIAIVLAMTNGMLLNVSAVHADDTISLDMSCLKIGRSSATMIKGQKTNLFLCYDKPGDENDTALIYKDIKWKSSNKKVAKVSKAGVVTAKKAGKATITGKFHGRTYKCKVKVYKSLSKQKRLQLAKKEAKYVVKTFTKKSMTAKEKATRLGLWVYRNVGSQHDQSMERYKKNYGNEEYSALVMHLAACSGRCKAYKMLCGLAGVPCKHVNANQWTHQYNRVKFGGEWHTIDTQTAYFDWKDDYTEEEVAQLEFDSFDLRNIGPIYLKEKNGLYQ